MQGAHDEEGAVPEGGWWSIRLPDGLLRLPTSPRLGVGCWWKRTGCEATVHMGRFPAFAAAAEKYRPKMTRDFYRRVRGLCEGEFRPGVEVEIVDDTHLPRYFHGEHSGAHVLMVKLVPALYLRDRGDAAMVRLSFC